MVWTIRYGDREQQLAEGTQLVGRDSSCAVRLEDDLVSRRHAALTVGAEGVSIRDLGSRNGVYLQQRRLPPEEDVRLFHGDTCVIGTTSVMVLKKRAHKLSTVQASMSDAHDSRPPAVTGSATLYEKFLAEADRSFAQGNLDRFATATHLLLESLGTALREGRTDDAALAAATRHALKLAELRGVEWIDQLLMVYDDLMLAPSIDMVTSMQRLFRDHGWRCDRLDRYVARIGPVLGDAGPRGRALLGQLETLRRLQA
ncbi:MAG: FHA domain-containing protein [Sandaracinaceae bacterium]|nr:FHA domain-containing protein [Sandaracinaceae bacterium]